MSYDLHKKYGDMRLLDTPICGAHSSLSSHASVLISFMTCDAAIIRHDISLSCPVLGKQHLKMA